jgi:hypothetical protein
VRDRGCSPSGARPVPFPDRRRPSSVRRRSGWSARSRPGRGDELDDRSDRPAARPRRSVAPGAERLDRGDAPDREPDDGDADRERGAGFRGAPSPDLAEPLERDVVRESPVERPPPPARPPPEDRAERPPDPLVGRGPRGAGRSGTPARYRQRSLPQCDRSRRSQECRQRHARCPAADAAGSSSSRLGRASGPFSQLGPASGQEGAPQRSWRLTRTGPATTGAPAARGTRRASTGAGPATGTADRVETRPEREGAPPP